jgi:hypothetical protein
MKTKKGFRVVRDFAGEKDGRASSTFDTFQEANELAKKVVSEGRVRVATVCYGDFADERIVRYVAGPNGTAIVAEVGRS